MNQIETRKFVRNIIEESVHSMKLTTSVENMNRLFRQKYAGTVESDKWIKFIEDMMDNAQHAKYRICGLTTMHLTTLHDYGHGLLTNMER